jgi:hypothetical protein
MRELSMPFVEEVVKEDTYKNMDEKTILCNIQGHLKSSKRQFLAPMVLLG